MKKLLLLLFTLISLSASAVTVNVGYDCPDDYIYQYDGIGGLEKDAHIGAMIRLTPDMYLPYLGAKIKSLRIGWADPDHTSACEIIIRRTLDSTGEVLATGKGTLRYKSEWNIINFDTPLVITEDLGTLYIGYYADIKKGAYAISKVYPTNQQGSNYVWRDDMDKDEQGNEIWTDLCDMGALAIQAVVDGTSAQLNNLLEVSSFTYVPIQTLGSTATSGTIHVKNKGANSVSKFTLTYTLGGETFDQVVSCSSLAKGKSANITIPVYGMGTGRGTVSVSKIGTSDNRLANSFDFDMIAVPSDVAKKYKRRPLIEFFESEGEYRVPKYYDEYFMPGYSKHAKEMTLIAHHLNDQFMLGRDEATTMMVDFADGDYTQVSIPSMMVDRTKQAANPACALDAPYDFIVFEWFADQYVYNPALAVPTFASVNIEPTPIVMSNARKADGEEIEYFNLLDVNGYIEPGVLTDEDLYLTVYMVEDQVESDSQDKPVTYDDKDDKKAPSAAPARKEDDKDQVAPGYYVHDNVIRERLTPMYGKKVTVNSSGFYYEMFEFELEDEYKRDDLRFVAVLHRGSEGHDRFHRNVINCAELKGSNIFNYHPQSIEEILSGQLQNTYYDLQGRTANSRSNGVIIVNGKKVLTK